MSIPLHITHFLIFSIPNDPRCDAFRCLFHIHDVYSWPNIYNYTLLYPLFICNQFLIHWFVVKSLETHIFRITSFCSIRICDQWATLLFTSWLFASADAFSTFSTVRGVAVVTLVKNLRVSTCSLQTMLFPKRTNKFVTLESQMNQYIYRYIKIKWALHHH